MRPVINCILLFVCFLFTTSSLHAQSWVWAKGIGGTSGENAWATTTDASGNVIVAGFFMSPTITFGTTTLTCSAFEDIFIVKYSPSGSVLWATSVAGTGTEYVTGIVTDASGNIYLTGIFGGTTVTFGATTLTNSGGCCGGGANVFIAKYDASGVPLWARRAGESTYYNRSNAITADGAGNVYIAGYFNGLSITFGTVTLMNVGIGSDNMFLVKYNPSGTVVWGRSAGNTGNDEPYAATADAFGGVYVTGFFGSTTITFGATTLTNVGAGAEFFIVKYDTAGNPLWANRAGNSGTEIGYAITTDISGNVYVGGSFSSSSITFGTTTTLINAGAHDMFIAKYSTAGVALWAVRAGGANGDRANCLTTDNAGNVYAAGYFGSPSVAFGATTLTNAGSGGSFDMFLAKYNSSGIPLWALGVGGTDFEQALAVTSDAFANIYVAGSFSSSSVAFGATTLTMAGGYDAFVAKYGVTPPAPITGIGLICAGTTTTLSDVITGGTWSSSNVAVGTVGLSSGIVTGLSAGTTVISYTTAGGYVTTIVTVNALPVIVTGSTSPVCDGGTLNLYAISSSGPLSYSWTGPLGYTSTVGSPVLTTITMAMAGTYSVTATAGGCSASDALAVVINPLPAITVSGNSPLCVGDTLHLLATSTSGTLSYLWDGPSAYTSSLASPALLSVTTAMAGTYTVTGTTIAGCSSSVSTTVVINPLPTMYTVGGTGTYMTATVVTLSGSETSVSYQLYNSTSSVGSPVTGTGSPLSFPVSISGHYFVVATATSGCRDTMTNTADIAITILPGFSTMVGVPQIIISPNPVKQLLSIAAPYIERVQVIDVVGKIMIDKFYAVPNASIDLGDIVPGIYIIKVNGQIVQKIVKE